MKLPIIKYIELQKALRNNLILAPTGNLGISRNEMPQIDGKYRAAFIDFMKSQGIGVRNVRVPARSLKLIQGEYNRDKVGAIIDSGSIGGAPIFVSSDGYIIDGNHRLIAHINSPGAGSYIEVTELGAEAKALLDVISRFPHVRYRSLNA